MRPVPPRAARPALAMAAAAATATAVIALAGCPRARPAPPRRPAQGVALGLHVTAADPGERRRWYRTFLDEIRDVGATDVSLAVRWSQADVSASRIGPVDGVTVPDEVVREVAGLARERRLGVFLLPVLDVAVRRPGQWRGALAPADPDAWWAAYRAFILHYARIAEDAGAALFAVGSELASMERDRGRWVDLVAAVRGIYRGRLTYSANWDHYEPVPFWDVLDVVGVAAYQPLSRAPDPTLDDLTAGWRPFKARLSAWAARAGRSYVVTEVGYPSRRGGAFRPWAYDDGGEPDPALQGRCYEALRRTWEGDPALEGLYLWSWFGAGGPADTGYTPRGKPAEAVLRRWWRPDRPPDR